ncbi:MAG: PHP domain-containing protein [Candidatus Omnitrophica bacterium]|nr:PHP domain-containing protein [Candidatus Omnitrophota bacterium]
MKCADLHIHTTFSDGTFTPARVIKEAQQRGISCIAITDHDSVSAIEPALEEASRYDIEVIAGIELSAELDDYEIHILGYLIDWRVRWFRDKLKQLCAVRQERALAILKKLKAQGIRLNSQELLESALPGSVGRVHIARMMKKEGFVFSIQEAFNKYIGNGRPCYVKKFRLTPKEAIDMINQLKGVAVLAHPYSMGNDGLIADMAQMGLQGIEAYYPDQGTQSTEHYLDIAQKYGLLVTGGSDCHGLGKSRILMGEVKIPYDLVEALKRKAQIIDVKKSQD